MFYIAFDMNRELNLESELYYLEGVGIRFHEANPSHDWSKGYCVWMEVQPIINH